jgi:uncharacterized membrane protein
MTTHSSAIVLVVAVFVASAVEMVEALTIVVAAGVSRGWRSTFEGVAAALALLALLVAVPGPALVRWVPLGWLRVAVGGVLLIFGLQWLRKAILRSAGYKAKHDEDAIFARQVAGMSGRPVGPVGRDHIGFTVAFKGVFLEGLEVVIVVLTLGSADHELGLAAAAAAAAVVIVTIIGAVVARQLAGVPENAMKMVVALMLVSFGTFWSGEGLGATWPGRDAAIPVLVGLYAAATFGMVRILTARRAVAPGRAGSPRAAGSSRPRSSRPGGGDARLI